MDSPQQFMGVPFMSEDGRLVFNMRPAEPSSRDAARFPWVVDVGPPGDPTALLLEAPAAWLPRTDEDATEAYRRLDRLQVELGVPSIGPTWTLMFARPTDDRAKWHAYDWVALRGDTALAEVVVFPEYGGTPYGPDDWDWQEGWWYPYATFRAAPTPPAP
jgi:hypothetical protein